MTTEELPKPCPSCGLTHEPPWSHAELDPAHVKKMQEYACLAAKCRMILESNGHTLRFVRSDSYYMAALIQDKRRRQREEFGKYRVDYSPTAKP